MAMGLAYRMLPRDGGLDDLVQDTFLYAFENLGRPQNPQAFAAWLGSIVVRTGSKRLRPPAATPPDAARHFAARNRSSPTR